MKAAEKYFKKADEAIIALNFPDAQGIIDKEKKGYVSSFGASVIQSGLLPALAFSLRSDSDAQGRDKIIDAIAQILGKTDGKTLLIEAIRLKQEKENTTAFDQLKTQIINASIALKLMMRTYEFSK